MGRRFRSSPCESCGKAGDAALPFCPHCRSLRDVPEGLTHFELLGLEPRLGIPETLLRDSFYALSKQLHPDRFVTAAPTEAMRALRWSTALNRAYQTLRDEEARALYLIGLYGKELQQGKFPLDLAEAYFERDEAEGSALRPLRDEVVQKLEQTKQDWAALTTQWDKTEQKGSVLDSLVDLLSRRRYLRSMLQNIERKLGTP